ncbi:hypothetical protein FSP39_009121 [Pinctada imbricata]|uniref:Uncharacterized protein n=1 Tax=Pinctada imbricata TaxID=66713 RepID=A0AA89BWV4_PINIB|nr:hypothetical protein FSP39_009121 [Pinctada imbricata]
MKIIRKVAKVNEKEIPKDIKILNVEEEGDEGLLVIIKGLFHSRILIVRWIIMLINWFVISFIYYGIVLNIGFLGEDLYLTFFINAVVETLGYCLQFFINKTGRRKMYLTTMFSMGAFFVASVFTDMYLDSDSGELFPTVVRGGIFGICAFSASIGSLITPYLYEMVSIRVFWNVDVNSEI